MASTKSLSTAEQSAKNTATLVYALYAASFLLGITFFVAVIISYLKREDAAETFVASHLRWQIRTFWFCLLCSIIGVIGILFVVGWVILFVSTLWFIYRIVRGWFTLHANKPMYADPSA